MRHKFLEDDILLLRAVNAEDAETMWDVENDSSQWIENSMSAPISRTVLTDYALSYKADPFHDGQLRLIVEHKADKTIAGIVDLYEISAIHRRAFIGIYILPAFRNRGLATRALDLLENYAFSLLNLDKLGAKIVINNKESIKLFRKQNFSQCGCIPGWIRTGNEEKDLLLFSKNLKNKY